MTNSSTSVSGERKTICGTGAQTRHWSFFAFLLNHILHCISFQILFTVSKYLVSNRSYARFIGTMKKRKNLNTKFQILHVIIIVHNDYFLILKLFRVIKGFILYQTKQTALKSGYNFKTYGKFTDTS